MTGLRCDDDTGTAGRDDVPELFQDQRGSEQVDGEDGLGLAWLGEARGVDDASDVTARCGGLAECVHRLAGGHVSARSATSSAPYFPADPIRLGISSVCLIY